MELERVPTPQHAAKRELPPCAPPPSTPPEEEEGLPLQYWAPRAATAKLPHYMFHEPGVKLRESLLHLEEMRGPPRRGRGRRGGGGLGVDGGRGKAERHQEEMRRAQEEAAALLAQQDADDEVEEQNGAASTVQKAWRQHAEPKR